MSRPLTSEQISEMKKNFNSNRGNQVAQTAATTNGLFKAAENIRSIDDNNFNFSIDVDTHQVTNQRHSGRCWMFSCLNVIRFHLEKQYNIENFELSQNYLFFYDKLEKANYFYQNILDTSGEEVSSRDVQFLLDSPQQDGGDWNLIISLVEKYGVVPKYEMDESNCSMDSTELNTLLNRKLRSDAIVLRRMMNSNKTNDEIKAFIDEQLVEVYRILSIALGTPPETINFTFRDKDKKYTSYQNLTPVEMYQKYIDIDLNDYAIIINVPTEEMPFNQTFEVELSGNMVDGKPNRYLNVEMDELKKLTIKQLKSGEPVWFACDVLKHFDRQKGIMSDSLYKFKDMLDVDFNMTKGERFNYRESLPTHAMVIAGVNIVDDKPTKWKVENSWGDTIGDKGFCVMDDKWMTDYLFEVVVKKEFLTDEQRANLEKEATVIPFWNPMNPITPMI